jgi:hypothetical protein
MELSRRDLLALLWVALAGSALTPPSVATQTPRRGGTCRSAAGTRRSSNLMMSTA